MSEEMVYDRIDKVALKDDYGVYECCYLLTGKSIDKDLEIEMTGDWFFNELEVVSRETVQSVSSIKEIIDFAKENDAIRSYYPVDTAERHYNEKYLSSALYIGGGHDTVLYEDGNALKTRDAFDEKERIVNKQKPKEMER